MVESVGNKAFELLGIQELSIHDSYNPHDVDYKKVNKRKPTVNCGRTAAVALGEIRIAPYCDGMREHGQHGHELHVRMIHSELHEVPMGLLSNRRQLHTNPPPVE